MTRDEQALAPKKRILCFGDSLTWGWIPIEEAVPTHRYPFEERWTGVMSHVLGSDYEIIEDALNGRTTDCDDPLDDRLRATAYLPSALAAHLPLDLVILMLGVNDTKAYFHRTPFEIAAGMAKLLGQVTASAGGIGTVYPAPRVLLVAPPPLGEIRHPWFQSLFAGGQEKSRELGQYYAALADFSDVPFLDAGQIIQTGGVDGVHLTAQNNADLGRAIAGKVQEMFVEESADQC